MAAAAAVALTHAIHAVTGLQAKIKWPNDILLGGKKLGGILVESVMHDPSRAFVVIGIGLNIQSMLFEGTLRMRATTLQDEAGCEIPRSPLAAAILDSLLQHMPRNEASIASLLAEFRAQSVLLGREVSAMRPDGSAIDGLAEEIDEEGRLIVRTHLGQREVLTAAEITLTDWGG
jgi:BirA family biotin operon repressor/biotin-[acetyl-CoA-carboxylase] ligase